MTTPTPTPEPDERGSKFTPRDLAIGLVLIALIIGLAVLIGTGVASLGPGTPPLRDGGTASATDAMPASNAEALAALRRARHACVSSANERCYANRGGDGGSVLGCIGAAVEVCERQHTEARAKLQPN